MKQESHIKNIIKIKPVNHEQCLECPYCNKSFSSYKNKKRHIFINCKEYLKTTQPLDMGKHFVTDRHICTSF